MKSINIKSNAILLTGIISLFSCQKSVDTTTDELKNLNNKALIQVYMGTVSATRNYVFIDGKPVTGAALAVGGIFPSTGYASSVDPGSRNFIIRDTLGSSTQVPLNFAATFEAKKNYTIFMYDTITSPKQLTVETPLNTLSGSKSILRFANIIHSKNSIPSVDIFSKRRNQNVFSNVNTGSATGFIDYTSFTNDTLLVRVAGTTTQLAALNSINLQPSRAYTVVFRGSYALTTGTNARTLSLITNY
jgi:hypothetical protein